MKKGILNILRVGLKELQTIFKNVGVLEVMFAAPILYPLLYSLIYYPEVVREMPIAMVDLSHSTESRKLIRDFDATPELKVTANCISMNEAILKFKNREVRGIVLIPESYSKDLSSKKQTTISAYADMEFFLYYKALMAGTSSVVLETGKQVQINKLMAEGLTDEQAQITSEPLKLVDNVMANQAGGFGSYGVPASLILIIHQTLILAIGIMAGTSQERRFFKKLQVVEQKGKGLFEMVIGKSAVYFTIYALLCVYVIGIVPQWFGYARVAGLLNIAALIIPFLLSTIFFGMTLSILFQNRESPIMLYIFSSIPLLFLSGVIWPLSNFGTIWLAVREIFPSSNAIFGFIKMNTLGASISETRHEIISLWVQTGVYFFTACLVSGMEYRFNVSGNQIVNLESNH